MKSLSINLKDGCFKKKNYSSPLLKPVYFEAENIISSSVTVVEKRYDVDARAPQYRKPFGEWLNDPEAMHNY